MCGSRGLLTDLLTTVGVVSAGIEVEVCDESNGAANPVATDVELLTGMTE